MDERRYQGNFYDLDLLVNYIFRGRQVSPGVEYYTEKLLTIDITILFMYSSISATKRAPAYEATIQAGIDAASNGGIVLAADAGLLEGTHK